MAILLFPGQGSQYEGMGKELYNSNTEAKRIFEEADRILGFELSKVMFEGSAEDLTQTSVTQPAVMLNSYVCYQLNKSQYDAKAVAGHSLGELTALIANETLTFEDGLLLVAERAAAMQDACNNTDGTMAAILGLEDNQVEDICSDVKGAIKAANFNCPGQVVISGGVEAINEAVELANTRGARRAIVLNVNGAFHSPLMLSAQDRLKKAIENTTFSTPTIPIYQNVTGDIETNPEIIKSNLISQLTSSVRWTQSMNNMIATEPDVFVEFGAKVLSGFLKKVDRKLNVTQVL